MGSKNPAPCELGELYPQIIFQMVQLLAKANSSPNPRHIHPTSPPPNDQTLIHLPKWPPACCLHRMHSSTAWWPLWQPYLHWLLDLDGPGHHLIFQTFQKPMNVYIYSNTYCPGLGPSRKNTPKPHFGLLHIYWLQNTHHSDLYKMAVLLACRLMAHGYPFLTLKPLVKESSIQLQAQLSWRPVLNKTYSFDLITVAL
jgi:hypothetical protein